MKDRPSSSDPDPKDFDFLRPRPSSPQAGGTPKIPIIERMESSGTHGTHKSAPPSEMVLLAEERDKLLARCADLSDELKLALMAGEDIRVLKAKLLHQVTNLRKERESALHIQHEDEKTQKMLVMYTDHIEVLLKQLRISEQKRYLAAKNDRAHASQTRGLMKQISLMKRKMRTKDKLISQMEHTIRLLNNQLQLEDGELMNARNQLDNARIHQRTTVDRATKEAKNVRTKFAKITGMSIDEAKDDLIMSMNMTFSPTGSPSPTKGHGKGNSSGGFSPTPGRVRPQTAGVGGRDGTPKGSKSPLIRSPTAASGGGVAFPGMDMPENFSNRFSLDAAAVKEAARARSDAAEAAKWKKKEKELNKLNPEQKEEALTAVMNKIDDKQRKERGEGLAWTMDSIQDLADRKERRRPVTASE